jgi:hypothetical protein
LNGAAERLRLACRIMGGPRRGAFAESVDRDVVYAFAWRSKPGIRKPLL